MLDFLTFLKADEWDIKAFYPYTSVVIDEIVSQSHNYKSQYHDLLNQIWDNLWAKAEALGCKFDNKIVLRIEKVNDMYGSSTNSVLYIGKKDGLVKIGLAMGQDEWLVNSNKYF